MDARLRDRIAIGIAILAFVLGVGTLVAARSDAGVRLVVDDLGRVVVSEVSPRSPADRNGIEPGMVVIQLEDVELIRLPQYIYPEAEPSPDPITGEIPEHGPIGIEPSEPTSVPIDPSTLDALVARPALSLTAIQP